MFERVLVTVDDSDATPVALSYVAALAHEHGSAVHVLNVNEILVGGRGYAQLTDNESARLVESAVRELRDVGIPASGSVVRTNAFYSARAIVDTAVDRGADAIVLSATRSRGLRKLLGGSVRDRVLELTSLPVVVAPPPLDDSHCALVHDAVSLSEDDPAAVLARGSRSHRAS